MIGPIPNSLGAGTYNGDFFAHGAVTFGRLGLVFPNFFQEVCLAAVLHPDVVVRSEILASLPVDASLDPTLSTPAVLHDTLVTDAEVLQDLQLDAIIEECP